MSEDVLAQRRCALRQLSEITGNICQTGGWQSARMLASHVLSPFQEATIPDFDGAALAPARLSALPSLVRLLLSVAAQVGAAQAAVALHGCMKSAIVAGRRKGEIP
jgi:hypothetical protein